MVPYLAVARVRISASQTSQHHPSHRCGCPCAAGGRLVVRLRLKSYIQCRHRPTWPKRTTLLSPPAFCHRLPTYVQSSPLRSSPVQSSPHPKRIMGVLNDDPALLISPPSAEHVQKTTEEDDDRNGRKSNWAFRSGACLDRRGPARRNPRRGAGMAAGEHACIGTDELRPRHDRRMLMLMLAPVLQELQGQKGEVWGRETVLRKVNTASLFPTCYCYSPSHGEPSSGGPFLCVLLEALFIGPFPLPPSLSLLCSPFSDATRWTHHA